ncbi:hypothetical protein GW932_04665 [archaeon]|nr:hypothetical protein [archaeon]
MIKKLSSKEDERKKQRKNNYLIGAVLVIVMFGSVFGIIVNSFDTSNNSEKLTYKGFPLEAQGNVYLLGIGNHSFYLTNNPNDLGELKYDINFSKTLANYVGLPLYLDSYSYTYSQQIYQNIFGYPERIQFACENENDCLDDNLPIKNCTENMIIIREKEDNKIYEKDNCVFIEGTTEEISKLVDLFTLKVLGIN